MLTASQAEALVPGGRTIPGSIPATSWEVIEVQTTIERAAMAGAFVVDLRDAALVERSPQNTPQWRVFLALLAALPVTGGGTWACSGVEGPTARVRLTGHPLRTLPDTDELAGIEAAITAAASAGMWSITVGMQTGPSVGHYQIGSSSATYYKPALSQGDSVRRFLTAAVKELRAAGYTVQEQPALTGAIGKEAEAAEQRYGGGQWGPVKVSW